MNHIELSKRALKDLRRIDHASRQRLLSLLERDLAAEPQPPNLDVKPRIAESNAATRSARGGAAPACSTRRFFCSQTTIDRG